MKIIFKNVCLLVLWEERADIENWAECSVIIEVGGATVFMIE